MAESDWDADSPETTPISPNPTRFGELNGWELLDAVDKLQGLGVYGDIPQPQIVVADSHDPEKSAVLEAISGIPFSKNNVLCTRLFLEIVLRRGTEESVAVHFISKSGMSGQVDKPLIDTFYDKLKAMGPLNLAHIPSIVSMASLACGVKFGRDFSCHVLRIEVTGAKQNNLTIIDFPCSLYATRGWDESDCPALNESIARNYFKNPCTIKLVIASTWNINATQLKLMTAKIACTDHLRTTGVIAGLERTHSDPAREKQYTALAKNNSNTLFGEWHVLRNLDFKAHQEQSLNSDSSETRSLIKPVPQKDLSSSASDMQTLKAKLGKMFVHVVGSQLKDVTGALNAEIEVCNGVLHKLGPKRMTIQDKRHYLYKISKIHQALISDALNGSHIDVLFSTPGYRLRNRIRAQIDAFVTKMRESGHTWTIVDSNQQVTDNTKDSWYKAYVIGETPPPSIILQPTQVSTETYLSLVTTVIERHQTFEERGSSDNLVVGVLFRDQSHKWKGLAVGFVQLIKTTVRDFMRSITNHVVDARRAKVLFDHFIQPMLQIREQELDQRLSEILIPYRKYPPFTCSHHFDTGVHRQEPETKHIANNSEGVDFDLVRGDINARTMMKYMQKYYNVAIRTVVDNIVNMGIECCLLDELETVFGRLAIARLSDEEVNRLASDFTGDGERRDATKLRLEQLKTGRHVYKQFEYQSVVVEDAPEQLSSAVNHVGSTSPLGDPIKDPSAAESALLAPRSVSPRRHPPLRKHTVNGKSVVVRMPSPSLGADSKLSTASTPVVQSKAPDPSPHNKLMVGNTPATPPSTNGAENLSLTLPTLTIQRPASASGVKDSTPNTPPLPIIQRPLSAQGFTDRAPKEWPSALIPTTLGVTNPFNNHTSDSLSETFPALPGTYHFKNFANTKHNHGGLFGNIPYHPSKPHGRSLSCAAASSPFTVPFSFGSEGTKPVQGGLFGSTNDSSPRSPAPNPPSLEQSKPDLPKPGQPESSDKLRTSSEHPSTTLCVPQPSD